MSMYSINILYVGLSELRYLWMFSSLLSYYSSLKDLLLSSPKLSLADRIHEAKKSGRKKPNREKFPESESDTSEKPKKKVKDKQVTKDKAIDLC